MNQRGMTLLELVIVLILISTLSVTIFPVYFSLQKQYNMIISENEVRENLLLAIERMKEDIAHSQGVVHCESNQLALAEGIVYQLKKDPQKDMHVYLSLSGEVLYRQENGKKNQPIANFLQEMQIEYFDGSGHVCSIASQVEVIEIKLICQIGEKKLISQVVASLGTGGKLYG